MEIDDSVDSGKRAALQALGALLSWPLLGLNRAVAADPVRPEPPVNAHGGPVVPPVLVPDAPVQLADGSRTQLRSLFGRGCTALQLVFTRCTTTCPMQGAIFQRVQRLLPEHAGQLVSISIDPAQDTPQAMREWLARFDAGPGWIGALPRAADLNSLLNFFGASGDVLTSHATQVQIIDRRGQLVWRTNELPSPQSVARLLELATDQSALR